MVKPAEQGLWEDWPRSIKISATYSAVVVGWRLPLDAGWMVAFNGPQTDLLRSQCRGRVK